MSQIISKKYKSKFHNTNRILELEQLGQEFEICLSKDFEKMDLIELNKALDQFKNIAGTRINDEHVYYSKELKKARDFLWFRITQEENKSDCVKVGDIFHTSWGYDQTNVEYFKVVEISKTGKTCKVVQIGYETVKGSEGFMCDSITPIPEDVLHNGKTCQVKIEKSRSFHPYKKQHQEIGEINLRGSVYFTSSEDKHLANLYRVDPTKTESRSWYA